MPPLCALLPSLWPCPVPIHATSVSHSAQPTAMPCAPSVTLVPLHATSVSPPAQPIAISCAPNTTSVSPPAQPTAVLCAPSSPPASPRAGAPLPSCCCGTWLPSAGSCDGAASCHRPLLCPRDGCKWAAGLCLVLPAPAWPPLHPAGHLLGSPAPRAQLPAAPLPLLGRWGCCWLRRSPCGAGFWAGCWTPGAELRNKLCLICRVL